MLQQNGIKTAGSLFVACLATGLSIFVAYHQKTAAMDPAQISQPEASENEKPGEAAEKKRREEAKQAAEKALLLRQRDESLSRTSWNRPACVAGHQQCVDCHKQEIKAWLSSKHSARAFDLLRTSQSALEYAKKLEIRPIDITKSSLCINCHGTPQVKINGRTTVFAGVSCESCHGSSLGTENGWLNVHAVYGTAHTLRENETPEHYAFRQQKCDEAGHLRSSDLYGMTKRCFECHVVGDEALSKAGHTHGAGFEMVAKSFGEIRHNFVLDERVNAKVSTLWKNPVHYYGAKRTAEGRLRVVFLLGQMVDLEMSLRGLSRATAENNFSDAMINRIEEAYELLAEDIVEDIEDIDMEAAEEEADKLAAERGAAEEEDDSEIQPATRPELAEIKSIVEIIAPVWEKLDDDGFRAEDSAEYLSVANSIAVLARQFSCRNGNELTVIDQLDLFPEDYFEGAYDPFPKPTAEKSEEDD